MVKLLLSHIMELINDTIEVEHRSLSKSQQKKADRLARDQLCKKAKRKVEQEKAREKYKQHRQLGGASKEEIKAEQLARLEEVKGRGIKVCIDFQFESLMIDKELNHLANQSKRVYSSNKASPSPFDLYFINLSKSSRTFKLCCEKNTGFENYCLSFADVGAEELFDIESIVYLSPDSDQVLTDLTDDCVYVIGGLVDDSVKKSSSQTFCDHVNIRTAKLPIEDFMSRSDSGGSFKQILTINQVFDVLLSFHQTKDWATALSQNIPPKTGFVIK